MQETQSKDIDDDLIDKNQIAIDAQTKAKFFAAVDTKNDDLFENVSNQVLMDRDSSYHNGKKPGTQPGAQNINPQDIPRLEKKESLSIPFEVMIAKKFPHNPSIISICEEGEEECTNLEHIRYDDSEARLSKEQQVPGEYRQWQRRQTSRLKGLGQVDYNINNNNLMNMRQSILDKSQSRDKKSFLHRGLQSFKCDPDLQFGKMSLTINRNEDFAKTVVGQPELLHGNSAPAKAIAANKMEPIPESFDDNEPEFDSTLLQLKPHEEIFFHKLSIMAVIPAKREEMLGILNTYGQRHSSALNNQSPGASFDIVSMAQKRL